MEDTLENTRNVDGIPPERIFWGGWNAERTIHVSLSETQMRLNQGLPVLSRDYSDDEL
jgi:hypothetical protein